MSTPPARVFISHSSQDAELARAITNLICRALVLNSDQVRCTSLDGHKYGIADDLRKELMRDVSEAEAFLGLVSPSSVKSSFVMFEMGARWLSGKDWLALLAPGAQPGILPEPLTAKPPISCTDGDLHRLLFHLAKELKRETPRPENYTYELRAVTTGKTSPPERSFDSVFHGFLHLNSTLFHEVGEKVAEMLRKNERLIPTKYLFAHADSYRHYNALVRLHDYTLATEARNVFDNHARDLATHICQKVALNQRVTLVSLGIGDGEKERKLLRHLDERGVSVDLIAVDINPAFIQVALAGLDKLYRQPLRHNTSRNCRFLIGDFDDIGRLGFLFAVGTPVLFIALSGIFGNQNEKKFLRMLREAGGNAHILMDFQTTESLDEPDKGGYESTENQKFISEMIKAFCGDEIAPDKIKALYDTDPNCLGRSLSEVPKAKTIVMAGDTADGKTRLFGYSTRYNKRALDTFLDQEGWKLAWEDKNSRAKSRTYLMLCKYNPDISIDL